MPGHIHRDECFVGACQPLKAVGASLFTHAAALVWLAASVGFERPTTDPPLSVTAVIGREPIELDELEVVPDEIEVQHEEYVEAPSLETPDPTVDVAGTLGGGPSEQIVDNPNAAKLLKREYRSPYEHPYQG